MRTMFILAAATLALQTSGAQAQNALNACSASYVSCMDKCVSRPSQSLQDSCMESCQTQNKACSSKIYGRAPTGEVVQQPQQPPQPQAAQQPAEPDQVAVEQEGDEAKPAKPAKAKSAKPARQAAKPARSERRSQ